MAPNSWLAYKRDTRYLLKWMIDKSNSILKSLKTPDEDAPPLNTTGAIRISDIVYVAFQLSVTSTDALYTASYPDSSLDT